MMLWNEVTAFDAVCVVHLLETTLWSGLMPNISTVNYSTENEYKFARD